MKIEIVWNIWHPLSCCNKFTGQTCRVYLLFSLQTYHRNADSPAARRSAASRRGSTIEHGIVYVTIRCCIKLAIGQRNEKQQ